MKTLLLNILDRRSRDTIMVVIHKPETEEEAVLLNREGFGEGTGYPIQITLMETGETHRDAFKWFSSRYRGLHLHLNQHYANYRSGDTLDMEFILGEVAVARS